LSDTRKVKTLIWRIFEFVKKEFIELVRDRKTLAALVAFPTVLLVVFTYAAKTDIENLPVAILDQDGSPAGRELTDAFFRTKYFQHCRDCSSFGELRDVLDSGKCFMGLVIPPNFGEKYSRSDPGAAKVQLIIDGSIPPTAEQASSYGRLIAAEFFGAKAFGEKRGRSLIMELSPVRLDARVLYNPELDTILFMIPGLVGYLLTFLTIMMSALAVIREREAGTFEQLLVTPITGFEIIVGKLVPFGLIAFGAVILILLVSVWWFGLIIRGSLFLFFSGLGVFIIASLIFGFFISSMSKNQVQAAQLTIFYMLPSLILSGLFFPIFSMPKFFQAISYLIPLRYFLVIMRGVTLKGTGFSELWPSFAGIGAFLLVSAALTMWRIGGRSAQG